MKQIALFVSFFIFTPILLLLLLVLSYEYQISPQPRLLSPNLLALSKHNRPFNASDAIISQTKGVSTSVQTADARPIIISEFLKTNNSPLIPYLHYGVVLTNIADKYQLDFRLLPSIMMQESNLCKKIPEGSFNCLGLGIHSQGTWEFQNFEDNFEAAAKVLREKYIDQGLITPDDIQNRYTPQSNGSWEFAVNHFMDVLETAEF